MGYGPFDLPFDERTNAERERDSAIESLTEAIRLTVEYVGLSTLPPIKGWSWYDALKEYAPDKARVFKTMYKAGESDNGGSGYSSSSSGSE